MSVDQYKKEIGMMNLEKLIAEREGISNTTFPIPDKGIGSTVTNSFIPEQSMTFYVSSVCWNRHSPTGSLHYVNTIRWQDLPLR